MCSPGGSSCLSIPGGCDGSSCLTIPDGYDEAAVWLSQMDTMKQLSDYPRWIWWSSCLNIPRWSSCPSSPGGCEVLRNPPACLRSVNIAHFSGVEHALNPQICTSHLQIWKLLALLENVDLFSVHSLPLTIIVMLYFSLQACLPFNNITWAGCLPLY